MRTSVERKLKGRDWACVSGQLAHREALGGVVGLGIFLLLSFCLLILAIPACILCFWECYGGHSHGFIKPSLPTCGAFLPSLLPLPHLCPSGRSDDSAVSCAQRPGYHLAIWRDANRIVPAQPISARLSLDSFSKANFNPRDATPLLSSSLRGSWHAQGLG